MEQQKKGVRITAPARTFSDAFKRMVVQEYERGILNKDEIQKKYGLRGNSAVLNWCRKFGKLHYPEKGTTLGRPMKDPQKQRIKELEKQLAEEKLKVIAYEKLIEIAEREEGISILKKDAAKQSKSLDKNILAE
jgi:transposase